MNVVYTKSNEGENLSELDKFTKEFSDRIYRVDTMVEIKIIKQTQEDKLITILVRFECSNKRATSPFIYEGLDKLEQFMHIDKDYWITLELETNSQFKALLERYKTIDNNDEEDLEYFIYDLFDDYRDAIIKIKTF